jgi:hypothetical protein
VSERAAEYPRAAAADARTGTAVERLARVMVDRGLIHDATECPLTIDNVVNVVHLTKYGTV